uniref:Major facilitator superfamily (MFS) profile domain-containing protein n=1 Tax=Branchiostoma floridae TaxID=7739 RepID=C3ZU79_BRAFL|eukprot:XP_002587954.1 hypothetical protein BRAFLDRAFT_87342 [Branchiostoma floridae]
MITFFLRRFLGKPEEKQNLVSKKKKKKTETTQDDQEPRDHNLRDDLLEEEEDGDRHKKPWRCSHTCNCWCGSTRYVISVMASLGFIISFGMRCNLGVSIIKMLENTTKAEEEDVNGTSSLVFISVPEFDWQPETVGVVSSAFLWGYLFTQVPGGYLAARYPANRFFEVAPFTTCILNLFLPISARVGGAGHHAGTIVFGVALFTTCILNLFLPVSARVGWGALAAVRVLQGLAEGMTYPAAHGIWSNWAPPLERTRLSTITFAGTYFGAVTGMPLSGLLADLMGWESPFYFYGAIGIMWSCGWYFVSSPSPARHTFLSREEQLYIEESIGNKGENKIMIGYLSAIPHFLMGLVVVLGGQLADTLRSRGWSTTVVRKLFNCGGQYRSGGEGFLSEGVFLLIAAACNGGPGVIALLTVAITVAGMAISGYSVNHLDVAPRYASILMGLSNCIGTVGGMLSPLTVGWLTAAYVSLFVCLFVHMMGLSNCIGTVGGMLSPLTVGWLTAAYGYRGWSYVFLIAGLVHINGVIFYFFFGSGDKQPWADPEPEEEGDVVIYTRDQDEDEDEVEFLWDYEPHDFLRLTRRDNFVQLPATDDYLYGGVNHRDFEY